MDALFREFGIYAVAGPAVRAGRPRAAALLHREPGRPDPRGGHHRGRRPWSSFTAAGTSYATRGVPMVPFFIFYSMFGFQRVGDLIWAAADARARASCSAPPPGARRCWARACSTRTATASCWPRPCRPCQAYDPAFAYEMAAIVRARHRTRMYGPRRPEDVFYYLTLYNENYAMPPTARRRGRGRHRRRPVPLGRGARRVDGRRPRSCSRARPRARPGRPGRAGRALRRRRRAVERHVLQAAAGGGARRPSAGTASTPTSRARTPLVTELLDEARARSSPSPTS